MTHREQKSEVKRILQALIKAIDRKVARMAADLRAAPDPARRALRPEQLN